MLTDASDEEAFARRAGGWLGNVEHRVTPLRRPSNVWSIANALIGVNVNRQSFAVGGHWSHSGPRQFNPLMPAYDPSLVADPKSQPVDGHFATITSNR
jgi:hypothetical protein